jgi:hypothetical protein
MGVNLTPLARNFYITRENFKPSSHDVEDGVITAGSHRVLRFDFLSHNIGNEDLAIGAPKDNLDMFEWSEGHGHYHLKDFNEYKLFDAGGDEVGTSYKQAFCLIDSVRMDSWGRANAQFTDCNVDQGISAGWADLYRSTLSGQYVVVDGLPNGKYTLRATTNYSELDAINEDTYQDNTILVGLSINGNKVTKIPPPYVPEAQSSLAADDAAFVLAGPEDPSSLAADDAPFVSAGLEDPSSLAANDAPFEWTGQWTGLQDPIWGA